MAEGFTERARVQDRNAATGGNAPSQQLAVGGIQGTGGAPRRTNDIDDAIQRLGVVSKSIANKKKNADFIEGQMASMAGKTQDEVAATGNKTSIAGFVSLEVSNAVSEWTSAQTEAAATDHYNSDPSAYQKHLSNSASELISNMGGDDYAEEQLTRVLAPAMQRLGAAQAAQHAQYTQTETINAYTNSLMKNGQIAAQNFEGSASNSGGPINGATNSGGDYRSFAQGISNQLIGVESGHNQHAQNPNSSAGGFGQFIDSTWIETVNKYRPDIAKGKSRSELLALKKGDGALAKQMSMEYTAEMARGLDAAGLPVTAGNTYLAYFAGQGGAKRVLKGDPNAPVSTTLTEAQIIANTSVMYKNGKLISNGELQKWANRKMGSTQGTPVPSSDPVVKAAIFTNPNLPPEKHRAAVTGAILTSLASGDGSLYQNAGGLAGLSELNLSAGQNAQIKRAHDSFLKERQNEYNMDYERARHNVLEEAASGVYSDDEMFYKLGEVHAQFGQSDAEMRRVHTEMQDVLKNQSLGVWQEPDRQLELMEIKAQVLDGQKSAEDAVKEAVEIGKMYGADEKATEAAVAKIIGAQEQVNTKERNLMTSTAKAGRKALKTREDATALIARDILGTGTEAEQEAGIAVAEQKIIEDLQDNNTPPQEMRGLASQMMSNVLVRNDVVDKKRASAMRAAVANPIGPDGKPTERAVEALGFFLDLKHGAKAQPEYLTRMFADSPKTLEMLYTAEDHMIGDADLDTALLKAHDQVTSPATMARIKDKQSMLRDGVMQSRVKEMIIEDSGMSDTFWNAVQNSFNPNWNFEKLDEEGINRIMEDSGLSVIIESETRSAISLMPNASKETIARVVAGQMQDRGAIIGDSFVIAPVHKSIPKVMGLNSKEKNAPNEAVQRYVRNHGEAMFGKAVWDDIKPTAFDKENFEFTVELVGDQMVIRPASEKYKYQEGIIFDDFASLPEAAVSTVPAKVIGKWYNDKQTDSQSSVLNSMIDLFK